MSEQLQAELDRYIDEIRQSPYLIEETEYAIVFLSRAAAVRGLTVVVPKRYRTHIIKDFSEGEYVSLHRLIWRVGRAVQTVTKADRLAVVSFSHRDLAGQASWHIVPLAPEMTEADMHRAMLNEGDTLAMGEAEVRPLASDVKMLLMML